MTFIFLFLASKDIHGLSVMTKVFIGVGALVLLTIFAGVGLVWNNKYGMLSTDGRVKYNYFINLNVFLNFP